MDAEEGLSELVATEAEGLETFENLVHSDVSFDTISWSQ